MWGRVASAFLASGQEPPIISIGRPLLAGLYTCERERGCGGWWGAGVHGSRGEVVRTISRWFGFWCCFRGVDLNLLLLPLPCVLCRLFLFLRIVVLPCFVFLLHRFRTEKTEVVVSRSAQGGALEGGGSRAGGKAGSDGGAAALWVEPWVIGRVRRVHAGEGSGAAWKGAGGWW